PGVVQAVSVSFKDRTQHHVGDRHGAAVAHEQTAGVGHHQHVHLECAAVHDERAVAHIEHGIAVRVRHEQAAAVDLHVSGYTEAAIADHEVGVDLHRAGKHLQ